MRSLVESAKQELGRIYVQCVEIKAIIPHSSTVPFLLSVSLPISHINSLLLLRTPKPSTFLALPLPIVRKHNLHALFLQPSNPLNGLLCLLSIHMDTAPPLSRIYPLANFLFACQ